MGIHTSVNMHNTDMLGMYKYWGIVAFVAGILLPLLLLSFSLRMLGSHVHLLVLNAGGPLFYGWQQVEVKCVTCPDPLLLGVHLWLVC